MSSPTVSPSGLPLQDDVKGYRYPGAIRLARSQCGAHISHGCRTWMIGRFPCHAAKGRESTAAYGKGAHRKEVPRHETWHPKRKPRSTKGSPYVAKTGLGALPTLVQPGATDAMKLREVSWHRWGLWLHQLETGLGAQVDLSAARTHLCMVMGMGRLLVGRAKGNM